MGAKVYLETSVVSYLTAWPSRDLIVAAHQQLTREWWQARRIEFDLFVSQFVIYEASAGDPVAAQDRLEVIADLPLLNPTPIVEVLAGKLMSEVPLPSKAATDALHLAISVVHGMDYLLTWNCKHLANASLRHRIENVCRSLGFEPPIICTPEELIEESSNDE